MDFVSRILFFFKDIWQNLKDGLLFLGGGLDMFIYLLDITFTAFIFYYILRILRDSRAWQLLRGILLIVLAAVLVSALGFNTVGFMFSNTVPVLAIALIIIFQPELRKTLESVGGNRFRILSHGSPAAGGANSKKIVESLVAACDYMSKTRTGALIIIERSTPLGDLMSQENAVELDAEISAPLLKQIFYVGSPLHDGGIIIRDGRVAAARIHVPLAEYSHLRREFGTRHRAAVGASEIGDTLSIVVSEERGTISLAVGGRLYVLSGAAALRTELYNFLRIDADQSLGLRKKLKKMFNKRFAKYKRKADFCETSATADEKLSGKEKKSQDLVTHRFNDKGEIEISEVLTQADLPSPEEIQEQIEAQNQMRSSTADNGAAAAQTLGKASDSDGGRQGETSELLPAFKSGILHDDEKALENANTGSGFFSLFLRKKSTASINLSRRQRLILKIEAFIMSLFMWFYVQITVDPVISRNYSNIPLVYYGTEELKDRGFAVQTFPLYSVEVQIRGRKEVLDRIGTRDIQAFADLRDVDKTGVIRIKIGAITNTPFYTSTEIVIPNEVRVNVYKNNKNK